jgi:glycosyltransferase involved in cell wall biosynthesis
MLNQKPCRLQGLKMRIRLYTLLLTIFILCHAHKIDANPVEKEIVVVIPSYNNEQWYERNLQSVLEQNYSHFRIIYVNDCSQDRTGECVEKWVRSNKEDALCVMSFDEGFSPSIPAITEKFKNAVNRERAFFTLVNNTFRCGALENLYRMIYSCEDHEIIVTVDGDDWLADADVLKRINEVYSTQEVWMTHGKFTELPMYWAEWNEPVPADLIARNAIREFKCPSHLRTFYAWIFKKIALEDLLIDGKFFPMAWDMAIMFPILEMAGERHYYFSAPNYIYNNMNPINDNKVNAELQRQLDRFIRNMKPYQRLEI